jgi:hypothetical protein
VPQDVDAVVQFLLDAMLYRRPQMIKRCVVNAFDRGTEGQRDREASCCSGVYILLSVAAVQ